MKKHIGYRPTWAEVNLDNLAYNLEQLKQSLAPAVKIMPTVKADAYGHGIIQVAKKLASCGVDYLGVASIDEGIALRKAGIVLPVLILGVVLETDIQPLFHYNLTPTVCTEELAVALNTKARGRLSPFPIHIKIDTGMSRLGVLYQDALSFVLKINRLKRLKIEGIFTHFAFADFSREFTIQQITMFNYLLFRLKKEGVNITHIHTANSMGIIDYKESHFTMVRPGLAIYGLRPKEGVSIKLRPVLSLKTKVVYVKKVPCGIGVSYSHTYVTKRKTTIATLPIGYGDGYPRNLSNKGPLLIKGRRFTVSGNVCMDQVMVDVGNTPVKVGDEVVLIGTQGKKSISAEELADLSGTIPYEIVCGLGSRIPRVYV